MVGTLVFGVAVLVPLLALSAFFSSSETAIFSLPAGTDVGEGADAVTLTGLREDPHRLLVTLLVGNNFVNVAISSVVTVLVTRYVPPTAAILATTLVGSTLVLVFGEVVPKAYGLGHARSWALRVARPLALVERLLGPVVWLFDRVTRRLSRWVGGDADIEEPYTE
jgi:Mg2+/Co2+ transporter CorB